jgi:hypothetical protein
MRTLAMPKTAEPWSLTSLREKLIKIGAKVVSHGRYVTFRGRGVAAEVPGHPVADRPATGAARSGMTGRSRQMRQTTTAEARLDEGKAEVSARRAGQPHDLVASRAGCEGILWRDTSMRRTIAPNALGIREMSD